MLDIPEILSAKNLYESIFESAQVPIVILDEEFKLRQVNPAFCLLADCFSEDVCQLNLFQIIQPQEEEFEIQKLNALKSNTIDLFHCEFVIHRKDGALAFGDLNLSGLKDQDGVVIGFIGIIRDITPTKKVESELAESRIRYNTLVENTLIGINLFDIKKQRSLYANQKFLEIFRMDKNELDIIHFLSSAPEYQSDGRKSKEIFQEVSQRVIKEGSCTFDWHAKSLDGKDLMLEIHASSLTPPNEHIHNLVVMDVTEKRKAERTLKEQDATLKSIFNSTKDSIFAIDINLRLLAFNDVFRREVDRIFQCQVEPNMDIKFLIEAGSKEMKQDALQRVFQGKHVTIELAPQFGKDNGNYLMSFSPITNQKNEVTGCTIYTKNITSLKQAQQALRESEEKFRGIYEQSPIGIVFYDDDKRMIANQKFSEIMGYSIDELQNMEFNELAFKEENNRGNRQMQHLLEGEIKYFNIEQRYVKKDGSFIWGNVTVSKLDLSGKGKSTIFILFEDITEKKRAIKRERELFQIKQKELITSAENSTLRNELEIANRELSSNLMFIVEQKALLNSLNESLKEISSKASSDVKHELFKVSSKVKNSMELDQSWNKFKLHFDQIHPHFFVKLQKNNNSLTQKELKQCAYLKIGLSNKEVAQLLGVSPKSIEMAKYRIKKKLDLGPKDNLNHFILSI